MCRIQSIFLSFLLLLTLAGCGGNASPGVNDALLQNTENLGLNNFDKERPFTLALVDENIYYFTLTEAGEILAFSEKTPLAKYSREGKFIHQYQNAENLIAHRYADGHVYAYDFQQRQLVRYDLENEAKSYVSDVFNDETGEIKDIIVIGETALVFALPKAKYDENGYPDPSQEHYGEPDKNGYEFYGEILYRVNFSDGVIIDLGIENPIALYKNTNGQAYCYAYTSNSYHLYTINTQTWLCETIADMNDVGYIDFFIYENGNVTYMNKGQQIYNKRMSDGFTYLLNEGISAAWTGCHMSLFEGHMVYLHLPPYSPDEFQGIEKHSEIKSIYIGSIYGGAEPAIDSNDNPSIPKNVTISDFKNEHYAALNTVALYSETGIPAMVNNPPQWEPPYDQWALLTEIMAGGEDVDIYIVNYEYFIAQKMREMGFFEPLNTSGDISAYVDGCFDYVSNAAKTESGELWMLPLSIDTTATWYIPANMDEYGVAYDDIRYIGGYIDTVRRLYDETNGFMDKSVYGTAIQYGMIYDKQYITYYNDIEHKAIDFNTTLYKKLFTSIWGGWVRENGEQNPLFKNPIADHYLDANGFSVITQHEPDMVIFKQESIAEHVSYSYELQEAGRNLNMADWRVYPEPRISEDVDKNYVRLMCAVVNPNSKNKDVAISYLEAVARNPHGTIKQPCFTQKDITTYQNVYQDSEQTVPLYDMSLAVFQDIYDIYANGAVSRYVYGNLNDAHIDDYQQGRLNLDEAIATLQRETEMWLSE